MRLRDFLHVDLGALLRGKVEIGPPMRQRRDDLVSLPRRGTSLLLRVVGAFLLPFRMAGNSVFRRRPLRLVTEQLGRIVACNAPLVPALDAIIADAPYRRARLALYRLRGALAAGSTLADAMMRQPRVFPRYYVDLIRAGENTGTLGPALKELRGVLAESERVRRGFTAPLSYGATLLLVCGALTTFLCLKVFPVFANMMRDYGGSAFIGLHRPLRAYMDFLHYFPPTHWWIGQFPLAIAILAVLVACWLALRHGLVRLAASHVALGIPLLRRLVIKSNLGHAARILQVLLKAGYPVDEALDTVATASVLGVFKSALGRLRDRVRRGESLSAACERESRLIPLSFRGMVSLGESSGALPESLGRIADDYEEEVMTSCMIASRFILPAVVLLMASWVFIVYSYPFVMLASLMDAMVGQI